MNEEDIMPLRPETLSLNENEEAVPQHTVTTYGDRNNPDDADTKGENAAKWERIDKKKEIPIVHRMVHHKYFMKHKNRGSFVVYNQENFDGMQKSRTGSMQDALMLQRTASKLGFKDIMIKQDLTTSELQNHLDGLAYKDHSDSDCFVCVFLTHGSEGNVLFTKDGNISLAEILQRFKASRCTSLAGKPKLFFIQACRGSRKSTPVTVEYNFDVTDGPADDRSMVMAIPSEADFLVAQATPHDFSAWRNKNSGSRFIQSLCKCLDEYADKNVEIMEILTMVNHYVAHGYDGKKYKHEEKKQIPSITTQLTAQLFFDRRQNDEPESINQSSENSTSKTETDCTESSSQQISSHSKVVTEV